MTPRDWELLSDWLDGTLEAAARGEFERRLELEAALAEAARRLRALEGVAARQGPTADDVALSRRVVTAGRASGWGPGPWVLLVVVALGAALWLAGRAATVTDAGAPALAHDQPLTAQPMEPSDPALHETTSSTHGDAMNPTDAAVVAALVLLTAPASADAGPPRETSTLHLELGRVEVLAEAPVRVTAEPAEVLKTRVTSSSVIVRGQRPGAGTLTLEFPDGGRETRTFVVDAPASGSRTQLVTGGWAFFAAPDLVRWSVGDPGVATVEVKDPDGGVLVVQGLRPGATTLEAWSADGSARKWAVDVGPAPSSKVRLGIGAQKVVSVEDTRTVTVEGASIDLKRLGNKQVLLVGRAAGQAVVHLSDKPGDELVVTAESRTPPAGSAPLFLDATSSAPLRLKQAIPVELRTPLVTRVRLTSAIAELVPRVEGGQSVFLVTPHTAGETTVTIEREGSAPQKLQLVITP